jgi:hypothetical protein
VTIDVNIQDYTKVLGGDFDTYQKLSSLSVRTLKKVRTFDIVIGVQRLLWREKGKKKVYGVQLEVLAWELIDKISFKGKS